jgi:hypothetical protein
MRQVRSGGHAEERAIVCTGSLGQPTNLALQRLTSLRSADHSEEQVDGMTDHWRGCGCLGAAEQRERQEEEEKKEVKRE